MPTPTAFALVAYVAWTLVLLVLMETLRTRLVLRGLIAANAFRPDNANLSPFMQRLARAHANCLEGFPVFGGLLIAALLTGRTQVTDALAGVFLAARIAQSAIHLASLSPAAVTVRFCFFAVQLTIAAWWCTRLLLM